MKFVVLLEERKIYSTVEYPVKILQNYIAVGNPKQIVVFEVEDELDLKKFEAYFKDVNYQLLPVVDAEEYEEKIDRGKIHGIVG
ncbi:hypothetical protein DRP05_14805 [Archaeoglobales archaeon]|nr:MAG: hypothetical protein DRP05_14805 [Archaeoglobales archaeon]